MNNVEKKKEQTSEQSFVSAVFNIRMSELDSMIHLKTSFTCSRQHMGNSPKMTEGAKKIVWHSESLGFVREVNQNVEGTK